MQRVELAYHLPRWGVHKGLSLEERPTPSSRGAWAWLVCRPAGPATGGAWLAGKRLKKEGLEEEMHLATQAPRGWDRENQSP